MLPNVSFAHIALSLTEKAQHSSRTILDRERESLVVLDPLVYDLQQRCCYCWLSYNHHQKGRCTQRKKTCHAVGNILIDVKAQHWKEGMPQKHVVAQKQKKEEASSSQEGTIGFCSSIERLSEAGKRLES